MVFDKINGLIFRDNYLSQTGIDSIKDLYIYLVNKKFSDKSLNQVLEHFNHQVRKSAMIGEVLKVSFIGIDERTNEIIYCFNIDKDEKKRAVAKCFLRPRCIYIRYSKNVTMDMLANRTFDYSTCIKVSLLFFNSIINYVSMKDKFKIDFFSTKGYFNSCQNNYIFDLPYIENLDSLHLINIYYRFELWALENSLTYNHIKAPIENPKIFLADKFNIYNIFRVTLLLEMIKAKESLLMDQLIFDYNASKIIKMLNDNSKLNVYTTQKKYASEICNSTVYDLNKLLSENFLKNLIYLDEFIKDIHPTGLKLISVEDGNRKESIIWD